MHFEHGDQALADLPIVDVWLSLQAFDPVASPEVDDINGSE
jgi:hypothetical protein